MSRTIMIDVDWQPIESAPKDGREIMILSINGGFRENKFYYGYRKFFWGVMSAFPEHGEMWVDAEHPENGSLSEDRPFEREVFYYNDHGQVRVSYLYRGFKATHWAEPWDVTVELPPMEKTAYVDKIMVDERSQA